MKWLKKRDGNTAWPWTEQLARRSDMVEISEAEAIGLGAKAARGDGKTAPSPGAAKAGAGAEGGGNAGDAGDASTINPIEITDKDELKRLLAERGVKLPGNPGLTTLQAKLAEVLATVGAEGGGNAGD